jgi:hypothetical protein
MTPRGRGKPLAFLSGDSAMRPCLLIAAMLPTWTTLPAPAQDLRAGENQQAAPAPDIGFDYRGFVATQMELLSAGNVDQAIDQLSQQLMSNADLMAKREEIKKQFSVLYGAAGSFEGHELVGYRRLSSRYYKFYYFVSFEKKKLVFTYTFFFESSRDSWRLGSFSFTDKLDALDQVIPFQPVEEGWQNPKKARA